MESSQPTGQLVTIGDRRDGSWLGGPILPRLIGRDRAANLARMVLVSFGEDEDDWVSGTRDAIVGLGVADVRSLRLLGREDAESPWAAGLIERSTHVLLEGDPVEVVRILAETSLDGVIRRRLGDSLVMAGVGRGASGLGEGMILEDPDGGDSLILADGLGYLSGIVFDPTFAEEGRLDHLRAALTTRPEALGIGVEAATAMFVVQRVCEVVGSGSVTILGVEHREAPGSRFLRHILAPGDRFDLATKAPIGGRPEGDRPD